MGKAVERVNPSVDILIIPSIDRSETKTITREEVQTELSRWPKTKW